MLNLGSMAMAIEIFKLGTDCGQDGPFPGPDVLLVCRSYKVDWVKVEISSDMFILKKLVKLRELEGGVP